jgi:hypothetical protein
MAKLDAKVIASQYVNSVHEIAAARSVQQLGSESNSFVLGYTQSDFLILLEELNLSQKQLKILSKRVL